MRAHPRGERGGRAEATCTRAARHSRSRRLRRRASGPAREDAQRGVMMPYPDLAKLTAAALAAPPKDTVVATPSEEARAIALVAGAIRARRRRSLQRRWGMAVGFASAAAILLVWTGATRYHAHEASPASITQAEAPRAHQAMTAVVDTVIGSAYALHAGQGRSVTAGSTLSAGDELIVQAGGR